MRTIKLYAHLIIPDSNRTIIDKYDWMAMDICQNTATLLARLFKGTAGSDYCGTVQYDDTIKFENITDDDINFILKTFPFSREIDKMTIP